MNQENENLLTIPREPAAATQPASGYKLDWETAAIKLGKGRFVHTLRRPTAEQIFARDAEISSETPIGKDGSFTMPDATATEDIDAKYHDELAVEVTGYPAGATVPARHKAAAFQGLYQRAVLIEDEQDLFAPEITVLEEIGSGDEPDFVIGHTLRQPSEQQIRKFRQRSQGGEMKPGRRGKAIFRSYSNLKLAVQMYDELLVSVDGGHVGGQTFSDENRQAFIAVVDPLMKRSVVAVLVGKIAESLLD